MAEGASYCLCVLVFERRLWVDKLVASEAARNFTSNFDTNSDRAVESRAPELKLAIRPLGNAKSVPALLFVPAIVSIRRTREPMPPTLIAGMRMLESVNIKQISRSVLVGAQTVPAPTTRWAG